MLSGYLTSYYSFTFPDFVLLPNYPLFPPRTTVLGICPARTGQNTWKYLEIIVPVCPSTKLLCETQKKRGSHPAVAAGSLRASCSTHCTHTHTRSRSRCCSEDGCSCVRSSSSALQMLQCFVPKVSHAPCTCALTRALPQKGWVRLPGSSLRLLIALSLVLMELM